MSVEAVEERFQALKAHAAQMQPLECDGMTADDENAFFGFVTSGDALAAHVSVETEVALQTAQDEQGLTALHHASADDTGLMTRVLIDTPNAAPFMKDQFGRTPLDVSIDVGNQLGQRLLFPVSYPEQFLVLENDGLEATNLRTEHLNRFVSFLRSIETDQSIREKSDRDVTG
ncbi:MAG: hypothetical protein AAFR74_07210 [Pseudomonadota bacterium]